MYSTVQTMRLLLGLGVVVGVLAVNGARLYSVQYRTVHTIHQGNPPSLYRSPPAALPLVLVRIPGKKRDCA